MACVRENRCAICRFEIDINDTVTVEIGDSTREFHFEQCGSFAPTAKLEDDNNSTPIHLCLSTECQFSKQSVHWFHRACRSITQLLLSNEVFAALSFSFNPDHIDIAKRERLLQLDFSQHAARGNVSFQEGRLQRRPWSKQLPTELWCFVACHFSVKEYAALVAERLRNELSEPGETVLDLRLPIHAEYRTIDGASYVSHLSNQDGPIRTISRVETGEDYCGVKQLRLHTAADILTLPEATIGYSRTWWSISSGHRLLRVLHDGLKVRRILPFSQATTDFSSIRISDPAANPAQMIKLTPSPSFAFDQVWMQQLQCNHPGVKGYFAQLGISGTITIREHVDGIDPRSFSQSRSFPGESRVWVYMPLHQDEYLKAIYLRVRDRTIASITNPDDVSVIVSRYKCLSYY
ncbi:hypothetical protein PG994_015172 [Apiospora phragmitis]|uniref:Uncharacterized protein n=1 Tax=Apiospora phragmitis TaxID=2905665 RepID=A0ABR1SXI8_9PEZI